MIYAKYNRLKLWLVEKGKIGKLFAHEIGRYNCNISSCYSNIANSIF